MTLRLPDAQPEYPSCGACHGETYHDGDSFVCDGCGLGFDSSDYSGFYLDDEAEPCGAACDNRWHEPAAIKPQWQYECGTCALPEGHTSTSHYTECQIKKVTNE